ncbi:MAG TPA: hypothetical protein VE959_38885 [Bryobacteraceae bacterium]|nr:hypothetical protein [Bryobacteraceae bacterium]
MNRSIVLALTAATALAQSWTSQLFPRVNGKYSTQAVTFAGRQWALDDYSFAGYYLGARSPGSVPCNVKTVTAVGDITSALQAAIDAVGKAGGGIVRIPAGSFTLSAPVDINYNNVSIEGAGSGQTFIDVPSNYPSPDPHYDGLFTFGRTFGKSNHGWVQTTTAVTTVLAVVQRGDMQVDTADASSIKTGDWIVVQQYFWPALTAANSQPPYPWTPNNWAFSFTYLRQVTGKTGNRVFLDAPMPWTLDPANNPIQILAANTDMNENLGIRGVSIHFQNNIGTDADSTGQPAPHGSAVFFEGVRNGWVDDVSVSNFPRRGIHVLYSARVTVLDSVVAGAQDKNGDGWGYGILTENSQNVLIKRCRSEQGRHNFITLNPLTSVVVLTQCLSRSSTQPDDTHFAFVQAILWDEHVQQAGGALFGLDRGTQSDGAWQTLASGVLWNFSGDGTSKNSDGQSITWGGEIHISPSPDGNAIVVGGPGADAAYDRSDESTTPALHGQLMARAAGLQVGTGPNALRNVLYEGLGQTGLQPASLFETQLANRFSPPPADWVNACAAAPVAAAGSLGNAASYGGGSVSPGELITVFGANLGPVGGAALQLDSSGLVSTNLAGARVFFDGTPAPMFYAAAGQVSAVAPYEVAGNPAASVLLEYQGQRSAAFSIPVAQATPGLFTSDGSGSGQGAIVNLAGGLNGAGNPAARGDIVILYATGAGQTSPAGVDGLPASPPLPVPVATVEVRIGGVTADLLYAGAAPGYVAGVLQLNVRIPSGITPGAAVPVQLLVGGAASQPGVTVAVR